MGKRGPKKGAIYKPTREKTAAKEAARAVIERHFERILHAQIEASVGLSHLMLRNEDGTWRKAEKMTADEVAKVLNGPQDSYYISMVAPSVPAFNTLAAYYLDKPQEPPQEVDLKGTLTVRWAKKGETGDGGS